MAAVVTLSASGMRLECAEEHPNLLTTLEAHHCQVEFQCREGYCGSCRIRLVRGQVSYAEAPLAFVQQGEILPCCCKADGDIEVEL